ncbi:MULTISPECIES: SPOR domain-containing protein [unclassified Rhizobium]|uniref:SPOR domain-containing protein n=1 Tax=unclassified Rhizobium TaxID=2613769 RepID=UPI00084C6804|nr:MULTISPECIES: SPOR domain-containing protein [unclassified Rhizobium]OEC98830.1 sporulation protein [Rhizobium sp. YK2]QYA11984.1 SPOR domain-containing protein [Rhizobium sp. AB2/73]UEQ82085.1 SPOR domain-containing protein [Rhizobium sp. AB2/73]
MAEKQLAYRASGNDEFFADDDPLAELARIVGFEPRPAAQATPAAQRQEPAFNLEDELLREFERYDTPRMSPANDIAAPAEQVSPPSHEDVALSAEPVQAEPKFEEPKFEELAPQPVAPVKPTIGARDLIDELEMSIAPVLQPAPKAAPVEPQAAAPVPKPTPQSAAATIRLPLANFALATPVASREQFTPPVAPAVAQPAPKATSDEALFDDALDFEAFDPVEPPRAPEAVSQPAASQPAAAVFRAPEPPKVAKADPAALSAEIDALLADVNRYPVPSRANAPAAKEEPDFGNFSAPFSEPAELSAAPVAAAQHEEPKPITFGAEDPFAGQDFEFDLADIEMELAGLDFAEAEKSPAAHQQASAAPIAEPILSRATPVAPGPAAPVIVAAAPQPMRPAPAPAAPAATTAAPVFEADQPLPFDPTEISETEDRVETFEGSHVPHLPAIEPEEPIAVPPEFDFDLDSEMASLLGAPAKEAAPEPIKPAVAAALGGAAAAASWSKNSAAQPAAPVAKQPIEEFDEFERALEEDFRRSYREAATPVENVARMTLNPAANRRPVRSVRGMVTTAAVIVVLGVGGYGAYSWVRHGAPISSFSGEPRVIAADSDPVKVAPENPGGTVVPNQDKAVYDRVAGDSTAAPKQKELVSSNEQPVDVVQKTLIPEAVSPDDSDGDQVTSTPVGETEDPRLLPNQNGGNTNVAANNDDQVPSVSPRKVRTMIVKPDGSLVPRDEPVADTAAPAAKPANNQVASTGSRPSPANAPAAAQSDNTDAASAESTPIRVVKTNPVPTARPEPAPKANTAAPAQEAQAQAQPKAQPKQVASASPAAAAPAATSAAGGGAYGVQIASLPTEADAQKSQANLKAKFASIIGNHPLEIRKADIAGKGTYYRVRVVAGSKDEAAAICTRYRAAGGTCLISR